MADDANEHPDDQGAPAAGAAEPAAETTAASAADPKAKADAAVASRTVARRTVQSRRVTPKGGAPKATPPKGAPPVAASKARDAKKTEAVIDRAEHAPLPPSAYAKGPSPWWVPALMFGLLIVGAALIVANYAGAFGDPDNTYLVGGLALILGGIITATQYR
jgi:hypothetical protein